MLGAWIGILDQRSKEHLQDLGKIMDLCATIFPCPWLCSILLQVDVCDEFNDIPPQVLLYGRTSQRSYSQLRTSLDNTAVLSRRH